MPITGAHGNIRTLANTGTPLHAIGALIGHRQLVTPPRYTHLSL